MKVAIFKKKDGSIALGRICDPEGNVVCNGDIEKHLESVVDANDEFTCFRITETSNLPAGSGANYDATFFEAFTDDLEGEQIDVDLNKAKDKVAHPRRRALRSERFKPVDGDLPYTSLNESGESVRVSIKSEDDQLQEDINSASNEHELRDVMLKGGLM